MSQKKAKKKSTKRTRRTKAELAQDNHYVHSGDFKAALADYYETDKITNYLGECIINISYGLAKKPNFSGYTYIEEMKSDAILMMNKALMNKSYKFNKNTNPFSYYTAIAWNAFVSRINLEKKNTQTIDSYREKTYNDVMVSEEYSQHGISIYNKPNSDND